MKKLFNLVLAFIMTFAMFMEVNAATTYSITINDDNKNAHTYEIYQIFTGDISENGTGNILSNIKWGSSVKTAFASANKAYDYAKTITDTETAEAILANLDSPMSKTFTYDSNAKTYTVDGLEPGYYLIKDVDGSVTLADDTYSEYIIQLLKDVTVTRKASVPTADKKIVEGANEVVNSSYAVGETVTYRLTGTMPSAERYAKYDTYKYIFHDTLSTGLTLNAESIKVYVDGTEITTGFTKPVTGNNFDVIFEDTKAVTYTVGEETKTITSNSVITVEYTATVNSNAVRGVTGNPNTLVIEFSNNPYTDETRETTPEIVKVYVFDLRFNKIASDTNAALKGAQFKLERKNGSNWETVSGISYVVDEDESTFHFYGLSAGTYKLTETVTPDGYNTITPVEFEIIPTYDNDNVTLTGLTVNSSITNEVEAFTVEEVAPETGLDTNATLATIITTITNIKGLELPLTGGIGTTIFTVIGLALMGLAVVSFIKNKKEEM